MDRCHYASTGFRRMDSPSRSTSCWLFPDQRSSLDMLGRRIQSMFEVILFCPFITSRGLIKSRAPGKLTGCEQGSAINLPGCFCVVFLLSVIKAKNAWLKNPTDLLHKNLMKPLNFRESLTGLQGWMSVNTSSFVRMVKTYQFASGVVVGMIYNTYWYPTLNPATRLCARFYPGFLWQGMLW